MMDKNIVFESDEAIMKKLDQEIEALNVPENGAEFRQTILKQVAAA